MSRFCALLLAAVSLFGEGTITLDEYRARRAKLRESLDGVAVMAGAVDEDSLSRFTQEHNFLYLTGWTEPGASLLLTKTDEYLILPPHNERAEIYTGKKIAPGDASATAVTGFEHVVATAELDALIAKLAVSNSRLYTLASRKLPEKMKALAAFSEKLDLTKLITPLRMVKSSAELALLQNSVDKTLLAHRAAWSKISSGLYEYQIAALMQYTYFNEGCEGNAYPPIIGSGPNSVILHYEKNTRSMDRGEVTVMDVGSECAGYAADITRTVPVGGKFNARQREIYGIVLGAQQAAIAAIKPGAVVGKKTDAESINRVAYDYINTHGKDLHGEPLGKYLLHGVSHHVGLDVHDPADINAPLAAGMVITIEPGIYIAEENIGIRIEDMVLVTAGGHRVMSAALPSEAARIEKLVNKK